MSYGYQGPPVTPFPGQNPPTSFGLPPGTPSAPNASSFPGGPPVGFNPTTTSYSMPQPYNQSLHPSQPGMPSPHPSQPGMPSPYPTQPGMPSSYPTQFGMSPTYPTQPGMPSSYPSHPGMPAPPMAQPSLFPTFPSAYSSQPSPATYTNPYPSNQMPQGHMYPNPNVETHNPYPQGNLYSKNPNMHTPISAPYNPNKGGSHSGGHGVASHNSPYGSSVNQFTPKLSPTVVACSNFDSRADAEALRKAMKGFGTDEKTIIQILANRTNQQRLEIANQFKTLYGKDLIKNLKSELSGRFEDLIVAMMTPLPQYYASELHEALSGIGTDESALIETLCTLSNHEIYVIKQAYRSMFGSELEDDLRSDTSGNFKRLLVSLCCGNRDESFNVNPEAARDEARQLLQAGELRFGTDESVFNAILVQRNVFQLKQIFMEYASLTGHDIENAIKNEFSGDIEKGLLAIVKCVKDRPAYFAERIYKSMKGLGTNDRQLIRLIVTRSEVDMGEIKQAFSRIHGQSLEDCISGDCSGDYKKCLLELIN